MRERVRTRKSQDRTRYRTTSISDIVAHWLHVSEWMRQWDWRKQSISRKFSAQARKEGRNQGGRSNRRARRKCLVAALPEDPAVKRKCLQLMPWNENAWRSCRAAKTWNGTPKGSVITWSPVPAVERKLYSTDPAPAFASRTFPLSRQLRATLDALPLLTSVRSTPYDAGARGDPGQTFQNCQTFQHSKFHSWHEKCHTWQYVIILITLGKKHTKYTILNTCGNMSSY